MLEKGISISQLSKYYGSKAVLDHVDLDLPAGGIYGLLGRNGAGKSTLMNILTRRIFKESGNIYIDGVPLEQADLSQVFMISDGPVFLKGAKIKEVFSFFSKVSKSFDQKEAMEWMERFCLNANMKVGRMSTGQSTLLKNILALSMDVPYLLLDEPVLGLDANNRDLFYNALLKKYIRQPQQTIILSSHLIEEISNLIQEVVLIKEGRILLQSTVDELKSRGYSVTGRQGDIDSYLSAVPKENILDEDVFGVLKTVYILGQVPQAPIEGLSEVMERLSFDPMNLQKLFVKLTGSDELGE